MAAANNDNEHVRSVDELKSAFKEGATPNEKDYGALIDLAAVGSKALGAADKTPTTPHPGPGLIMDNGKLTVHAGNGVTVDQNGVAVIGDEKSVTVSQTGVSIKVKENGGLATDAGAGLHVNTGTGLKTDGSGLEIKLADKSGLKADTDGLAVNVAAGLEVDNDGVLKAKVKAGEGNYITSDKDGLAITKDGVAAIEKALKSVSLDALGRAVLATSKGFKTDSNTAESDSGVEKNIAVKLNEAFREGWHLTQPRAALFTALKTFRSANKAKIFENGLIAPSAVTGHAGLYNQEGTEYTAGTVIAYKVSTSGVAGLTTGGGYTEDGIYALVGKLDTAGAPKNGDAYEKVTPHALMVLVAQTEVTVVGHWDFKSAPDWTSPTSAGAWRTGPPTDGVLKHMVAVSDENAAQHKKSAEEYAKKLAEKENEVQAERVRMYDSGLTDAAAAPTGWVGNQALVLTVTRTGNKLVLHPTDKYIVVHTSTEQANWGADAAKQLKTRSRLRFSVKVYGVQIWPVGLVGDARSNHESPAIRNSLQMEWTDRGGSTIPDRVEVVCERGAITFLCTWPGGKDDLDYDKCTVSFTYPGEDFQLQMSGPRDDIQTIFKFA